MATTLKRLCEALNSDDAERMATPVRRGLRQLAAGAP
jgi:hypothetical protein